MTALTKEDHQRNYHQIIRFYDLAEELIDSVQAKDIANHEEELAFVEPLVQKVEDATDLLAAEYRKFVENGKPPGVISRRRIEKALNDLYGTIETFRTHTAKKIEGS